MIGNRPYNGAMRDTQSSPVGLTTKEAAAALKLSPDTVRRWCADGTLRAARVGRLLRVPASEVARLLTPTNAAPAR